MPSPPRLVHDRAAGRWDSTNYNNHIDAARDCLVTGGYGMEALTHAMIALAMIQRQALEEGHWGGNG